MEVYLCGLTNERFRAAGKKYIFYDGHCIVHVCEGYTYDIMDGMGGPILKKIALAQYASSQSSSAAASASSRQASPMVDLPSNTSHMSEVPIPVPVKMETPPSPQSQQQQPVRQAAQQLSPFTITEVFFLTYLG